MYLRYIYIYMYMGMNSDIYGYGCTYGCIRGNVWRCIERYIYIYIHMYVGFGLHLKGQGLVRRDLKRKWKLLWYLWFCREGTGKKEKEKVNRSYKV